MKRSGALRIGNTKYHSSNKFLYSKYISRFEEELKKVVPIFRLACLTVGGVLKALCMLKVSLPNFSNLTKA